MLWIKLFFDARYKASLATILITNFSLFATMKIFTKDSWARVFKFYLILTTSMIISEFFCALVFFGMGLEFDNMVNSLPGSGRALFLDDKRKYFHVPRNIRVEQNI